jgi:hypothetical protein
MVGPGALGLLNEEVVMVLGGISIVRFMVVGCLSLLTPVLKYQFYTWLRMNAPPTQTHFFQDAPVLTWRQWLVRRVAEWIQSPIEPTLLSSPLLSQPIVSPTGRPVQPIQPAECEEVSRFLHTYFTDQSSPVTLNIPPHILAKRVQDGRWKGFALRTHKGALVGVVWCFYAGQWKGTSSGLITWLCVEPSWRKRGVVNCLLRTVAKETLPWRIHIWRTDGWLQSPVPPVYTQTKFVRRSIRQRTNVRSHTKQDNTIQLHIGPLPPIVVNSWKRSNPNGLCFEGPLEQTDLMVWTRKIGSNTVYLVLQPTYEVDKTTGGQWCEIIHWVSTEEGQSSLDLAMNLEAILDQTPFGWFEAPDTFPRLEGAWSQAGQTSWSLFGMDPGIPVQRSMISFQTC